MALEKLVSVPDIGDFKDVEIIEVLVKPGDSVNPEDPLIALESDKAAMEVPSPLGGVVKTLEVKLGDRVSKGSPILTLVTEETVEAPAPAPAAAPAPPAAQAGPAEAPPEPKRAEVAQEERVLVPDIGDFKDVEIVEVLVKPGDVIQAEDPLIALESDKATMEVPSPLGGVVKTLEVKLGDRVSKGSTILTLVTTEGAAAPAPAPAEVPPGAAPSEPKAAEPIRPPAPGPTPPAAIVAKEAAEGEEGRAAPPHASPSVRKFARELGADLASIRSGGPKGRILKEDVQAYVKQRLQQPERPATTAFGFAEAPEIDFAQFGVIERQPLSRIKKLSAANLHRAWVSIPHVTHHDEADITELDAFRVSLKPEADKREVKLTLLPFVMKAVVATLKAFPSFNASLTPGGEELILKRYYHLGFAADTPEGLVVPVVRDADQKGVYDLARELAELSARARGKKLKSQEMQGGSFTISSLGGIGGVAFTPIVNAPEVAILGLCRTQTRPLYRDGQWLPRLMLPLSLSYDHRVIDGAEAARFTAYLSQTLSDLRRILL